MVTHDQHKTTTTRSQGRTRQHDPNKALREAILRDAYINRRSVKMTAANLKLSQGHVKNKFMLFKHKGVPQRPLSEGENVSTDTGVLAPERSE